jgi:mono/diheme cytochrome c family protein
MKSFVRTLFAFALVSTAAAAVPPLLEKHCVECHDAETKKGDFDLTALKPELTNPQVYAQWVKVYDQIASGEMPPAKKPRPETAAAAGYLNELRLKLRVAEESRIQREGRTVKRRLNRFEYENTLRDLLRAPWLDVRESLPEDTEAHRFNKSGEALDVSHVQLARYISTADEALRQVLVASAEKLPVITKRYYARDQGSYTGPMKFSVFNQAPERATFPTLGFAAQPEVRAGKAPISAGKANAAQRELEGVGVVASAYEPIEPKFSAFKAPVSGRYQIKLCGHSVWVGPGEPKKWFIPNLDVVSKGRRPEPVTVYALTPPRVMRRIGNIDLNPDVTVANLDVQLLAGESIQVDAVRFFRSRPGASRWQNPLAEKDGQPGMVMRWIEVEGPLVESWPTASYQQLFDDLPAQKSAGSALKVDVTPRDAAKDAERLLRRFVQQAYRRPVSPQEEVRFLPLIQNALKTGSSFAEAMVTGYTAVLTSPSFLYLQDKPGRLDDYALAERLAYFLWNSAPDAELLALAKSGQLHEPATLRKQTDRLLDDPRSQRFVSAFLDYWLELRKVGVTNPDENLYPDYYLDDHLVESAGDETRLFFAELLKRDLPARNVAASDFVFVNERLARLYDLPPVIGAQFRKVTLPAGSVRGGLLTQASVLKVTANGTTTSPVVRGAWMMERILGRKPPPPPASVPAVEPDIRGATTIRQQLESHRKLESCSACHTKIDPPGFALESFDIVGGFRKSYRAIDGKEREIGFGKNGQKFAFHNALPVEPHGQLGKRNFADIREFKALLVQDERQLARNLVGQLTVFATGAPVGFADRPKVEKLLDDAQASTYGVRTLVRGLVTSDLFLNK